MNFPLKAVGTESHPGLCEHSFKSPSGGSKFMPQVSPSYIIPHKPPLGLLQGVTLTDLSLGV